MKSAPYQPLLLRLFHGSTAIFLIGAILTAYWTYDTYDGRWFRFLPKFKEIEGIHGTFGLYVLLIFPLFAIYIFRRGQKRLLQSDSLQKLTLFNRPIWWYSLHRLVNTLSIFALTFAIYSGRMMDSEWLPRGELDHFWYYAHLVSWVIMVACIILHLIMTTKVGGVPLLLSIINFAVRPADNPGFWWGNIRGWLKDRRMEKVKEWFQSLTAFKVLEISVLTIIALAWIVPYFKLS